MEVAPFEGPWCACVFFLCFPIGYSSNSTNIFLKHEFFGEAVARWHRSSRVHGGIDRPGGEHGAEEVGAGGPARVPLWSLAATQPCP